MRTIKIICIILAILSVLLLSFEVTLHYYKPSSATTVNIIYDYLLLEPYTHLINVNFIDIKERRHLLDVKRWLISINNIMIVLSLCFAVCILFLKYLEKTLHLVSFLKKIGQWGFFVNISLSILFLTSFKPLFISSHSLLFKQGTWVFSKNALLTELFPLSFFENFTYFLLGGATVFFVFLIAATYRRN